MANWLAVSSLLLIPVIAPPQATSQTGENLVDTPTGVIYNINEREDAVRVPLTFHDGISVSDLDQSPVLFDVAFGKVRSTALLGSLRPSLAPDGALLIAIGTDPPFRQGAYEVRIQLRPKGNVNAKFKRMQELDLQIVKPAAQIRPPGPLLIHRVLGLPWVGTDTLVAPALPLKENSELSRLAGIHIDQVTNLVPDVGPPGDCTLQFKDLPKTILPGDSAWVRYDVPCSSTAGTLKGVAQVRAAELASPVELNVEIHTRRTRWWIGLIAALGLLTGYFTRIAIPLWARRDQARVEGLNMLAQIDAETGRRKDAQFQADCTKIRDSLVQALKSNPKPDALAQATTQASSDLAKALADLQARRVAAQAKVDQLAKLVGTPWSLPSSLQGVVDAVRPNLAASHAALLSDNAEAADAAYEAARIKLASNLREPLQTWEEDLFGLLDALGTSPMPSTMASGFQASVERVRGLINSVGDPGADPPFESMAQALSAVDIARMAVRELLLQMQRWPQDTQIDVEGTLRQAPLVDFKAVDVLATTAQTLLDILREAANAPEGKATTLATALQSLDQAWHAALLAQITDPNQVANIQASLEQGQYSAAARAVAQILIAPLPRALDLAPADARATVVLTSAPTALWTGITGMTLQPRDTTSTAGWWNVDLSPGQIPVVAARAAQESRIAQLIQTLVAGAGIVLVSYLANGDKFVGTFADLAGIFSWAFVSDITIDALVTAAKGVRKS
jgi:hypothetical protein